MEYVAFIDESPITDSRFCSLTPVSFPLRYYERLNDRLSEILRTSGVTEFGWAGLRNKKCFFCAEKLLTLTVENHAKYNLRVDVLVWDTHDSRHTVVGRDDMANHERMFFHLLKTSMKRRERKSTWYIYPDERNGIDWETTRECLSRVGETWKINKTLFGCLFLDPFFTIKVFEEKDSAKEPLIQLADLFSGLAIFLAKSIKSF